MYNKEIEYFINGPEGPLETKMSEVLLNNLSSIEQNDLHDKEMNGFFPDKKIQQDVGIIQNKNLGINSIAIICHPHPVHQGTMDNKVVTTLARAFQNSNMATIRFNFRGVGKSEGQYAEGIGEIEDLRAVVKWVTEQFPTSQIVLSGFSFGSYIAYKLACEMTFSYLITVAPSLRLFKYDELVLPNCPWLIIHGSEDELTPLEEVEKWVKELNLIQNQNDQNHISANQDKLNQSHLKNDYLNQKYSIKLEVLPEATHFFHGKLIELRKIMEDQFAKN